MMALMDLVSKPFGWFLFVFFKPLFNVILIIEYGVIVVPLKVVRKVISIFFLPLTLISPPLQIELSFAEVMRDVGVVYQFVSSSVVLGVIFGAILGLAMCIIKYLFTFNEPHWVLSNPFIRREQKHQKYQDHRDMDSLDSSVLDISESGIDSGIECVDLREESGDTEGRDTETVQDTIQDTGIDTVTTGLTSVDDTSLRFRNKTKPEPKEEEVYYDL